MTFTAMFRGRCVACGETIVPGTQIVNIDTIGYMHDDCTEAAPVERVEVMCTECFIMKPCECDDE